MHTIAKNMVSGKAKLDELHNDHYLNIQPTTVKQYVSQVVISTTISMLAVSF